MMGAWNDEPLELLAGSGLGDGVGSTKEGTLESTLGGGSGGRVVCTRLGMGTPLGLVGLGRDWLDDFLLDSEKARLSLSLVLSGIGIWISWATGLK
jgi:hypothetical protein